MLSYFLSKDRWKWDPAQGTPNKKVLKLQRQTLRSGNGDVKKRLLEHIRDLAEVSEELQSALCDGKVTAEVCTCFLSGNATVQLTAAGALVSLCDGHPGNCAAVVAARHATLLGGAHTPLPHALRLLQDNSSAAASLTNPEHLELAVAAAALLDAVAASESGPLLEALQQPGCVGRLMALMRGWSRAARSAAQATARSERQLLRLLTRLLGVLQCAASSGGAATCRELLKAGAMGLLLDLAQDHRGYQDHAPAAVAAAAAAAPPGAGAVADGGGVGGHAGVVRDALNLLFVMLLQVPAHRMKLREADGVQRLLAVLRDLTLPWSVRLQAVAALTAAAASPAVAEEVRARGLDAVVQMVQAYASGRAVPGAPGGIATTPQRAAAPASPAAILPTSPADSAFGGGSSSPLRPGAAAAGGGAEPEPRTATVVEQLLGLLDAVAGAVHTPELCEERRLGALLAALNSGLASFSSGGGFRMATAAAQVLFRLSTSLRSSTAAATAAAAPLPAALCGPSVTGPLVKLMSRALEHAAACSGRDAQVLHGGWCAVGLLCKVLDSEQQRSEVQQSQLLAGGPLRTAVQLMDESARALLVAVGAAPPPYAAAAAAAASIWQTPGPQQQPVEGSLRPDGRAYLAKERVVSDLRCSVPLLLGLLAELAQRPAHQPALRELGVVEAVRQLMPWRQVQWRVKRLLHLLGELEVEYKPFPAYGCGPLLAAALASQRLDPAPFLQRGVDSHLLLGLDEGVMRDKLGLDQLDVMKVRRLQDAHSLFCCLDSVDGRVDGCVTCSDLESYLTGTGGLRQREAQELCEATFRELQVLPGEPFNFLQFLQVYPSLVGELEAVMPGRPTGHDRPVCRAAAGGNEAGAKAAAGAAAAEPSTAGVAEVGVGRTRKRQRVGGFGDGSSEPAIELE